MAGRSVSVPSPLRIRTCRSMVGDAHVVAAGVAVADPDSQTAEPPLRLGAPPAPGPVNEAGCGASFGFRSGLVDVRGAEGGASARSSDLPRCFGNGAWVGADPTGMEIGRASC